MISLQAFLDPRNVSLAAVTQATGPARLASLVMDYAEYCGFQDDNNGGGFELWTLKKAIPGHPAGSTVARLTLENAIRVLHPAPNYGKIAVAEMELPAK